MSPDERDILRELRSPDRIMHLKRLGASFPTRLSFTRTMLRKLADERVQVRKERWAIDEAGFGTAVYSVRFGGNDYSLVAFSTPLEDDDRTDRVIAEAWDTTFVLYDGIPDDTDVERLRRNAPLQEAGRYTSRELVLSRANKSVRFFQHVVDSLAKGLQPDADALKEVGYLLRTTAVYGNGKFGIADRGLVAKRPGLRGPFQAEMLTVWLVRNFSIDLVEHVAASKAPGTFVKLERAFRTAVGVGNSTGLGMAPFLSNHPILLNNWVTSREQALAAAIENYKLEDRARLVELARRAQAHLVQWTVADACLMARIETLRTEWAQISDWIDGAATQSPTFRAIEILQRTAELSLDCQELAVSLLVETAGQHVDVLETLMIAEEEGHIRPDRKVKEVLSVIEEHYRWSLDIDFQSQSETARFWYVSEEKLEPRLGERYQEEGAELELPLDIGRQIQKLRADLVSSPKDMSVAEFLQSRPEHRHALKRVEIASNHPFSEIQDNLLSEDCLPIDMLRFKLAFFGASKFDPRSDRWTRITLFQGAPTAEEISAGVTDDCWLPVLQ